MDGECGEKEKNNEATEVHAMSTSSPHLKGPEPVVSTQLESNSKDCISSKLVCDDISRQDENPYPYQERKQRNQSESNSVDSRGLAVALNARSSSSLVNRNPFHPYRNLDHFKSSTEVSECASSTDPLEEDNNSLRIWKEMKQNGFQSCSHEGTSVPKKCGRKRKSDLLKEKLELAKKEKVDRFAKLAAPSGLLNGLNPGIINHVRNSKQVHSIIEALAKSERSKAVMDGSKEASHVKKDVHSRKSLCSSLKEEYECGASGMIGKLYSRTSCTLSNPLKQEDTLGQKSSLSVPIQSVFTSDEQSANPSSITSLSVKAATVASQWLQLLHQDIKGRLAAVRHSKERVYAVINTELPFLMSKEFSSKEEDDHVMKNYGGHPSNESVDMHRLKWSSFFDQMGKALLKEEQELENWLKQVREMELHCENGLQSIHYLAASCMQKAGTTDNISRSGDTDIDEREQAVRAAAASIYSTCNFVLSKADVLCC